jgi:hypothetical protein
MQQGIHAPCGDEEGYKEASDFGAEMPSSFISVGASNLTGGGTDEGTFVAAQDSQPQRPQRYDDDRMEEDEVAPISWRLRAAQGGHEQHSQEDETKTAETSDQPNEKSHLASSGSEDGGFVIGVSNIFGTCNLLHEQGAELDDSNQEHADSQHEIWERGRRRGAGAGALASGSIGILARRAGGRHAARDSGIGGARGGAPPGRGVVGDSAAD